MSLQFQNLIKTKIIWTNHTFFIIPTKFLTDAIFCTICKQRKVESMNHSYFYNDLVLPMMSFNCFQQKYCWRFWIVTKGRYLH